MSARYRVLHIGGNPSDVGTIRRAFAESTIEQFDIEWVQTVDQGIERLTLTVPGVSAVLLDFQQSEEPSLGGLKQLLASAPAMPVLVVGGPDTELLASQAVEAGACDYLLASQLDHYWLPRLLLHVIGRRESDNAFYAEQERVEITLNSLGDALLCTDLNGNVCYVNELAEALTGWSRAEAAGRPLEEVLQVLDETTRERLTNPVEREQAELSAPILPSSCIVIRRNGSESAVEYSSLPILDRLGAATGATIVLRDVSAARAASLSLSHLASHDPLTDLPNRLLLGDRLARALSVAHRHRRRSAILFLDVDHFKAINDSLGHLVGDELLRAIARRVTVCVRSSDTVSRHGGDEFVVVLSELEQAEDAAKGAEKILAALAAPYHLGGCEIRITASIGISVFPNDGNVAGELLTKADMALYRAKELGRNGYQFFEPSLMARVLERASIEADLHRALDNQEFQLHYQPQVNLATGKIVGAEALVYWQHPDRGLIDSSTFLATTSASGLAKKIGRWAITEACRQARNWQSGGLPPVRVAVSISDAEYRSSDFLENISHVLDVAALDPRRLNLEVAEPALVADVAATTARLRSLKSLGVRLAVDDFGVGWCNLDLLRRFPIDALKINKSLMGDVTEMSAAAPAVTAVIGLAKGLGYEVTAEGVATREQVAFLRAEGCHDAQGPFFGQALPEADFLQVLKSDANHLVDGVA